MKGSRAFLFSPLALQLWKLRLGNAEGRASLAPAAGGGRAGSGLSFPRATSELFPRLESPSHPTPPNDASLNREGRQICQSTVNPHWNPGILMS